MTRDQTWVFISPPRGWSGYGHLPASADICDAGDQDLVQFRRGDVTIDVGFYGTGFRCVVVDRQDWERPRSSAELLDPVDVFGWLLRTLDEESKRSVKPRIFVVRSDQPTQVLKVLEFDTESEKLAFKDGLDFRRDFEVPRGANGIAFLDEPVA